MYPQTKGMSETEISQSIDKRISDLMDVPAAQLKNAAEDEQSVMATPVILSIVRATAYVHC
jgi:hypothetical protein